MKRKRSGISRRAAIRMKTLRNWKGLVRHGKAVPVKGYTPRQWALKPPAKEVREWRRAVRCQNLAETLEKYDASIGL